MQYYDDSWLVSSSNAILNFIWILGFRFHMQCLLYYVVCFKVCGTTSKVFVVHAMKVALANHEVFTCQHAQDAKVTLSWYGKANGIPSPSNSDTNDP
jgi:hypothetical protein